MEGEIVAGVGAHDILVPLAEFAELIEFGVEAGGSFLASDDGLVVDSDGAAVVDETGSGHSGHWVGFGEEADAGKTCY